MRKFKNNRMKYWDARDIQDVINRRSMRRFFQIDHFTGLAHYELFGKGVYYQRGPYKMEPVIGSEYWERRYTKKDEYTSVLLCSVEASTAHHKRKRDKKKFWQILRQLIREENRIINSLIESIHRINTKDYYLVKQKMARGEKIGLMNLRVNCAIAGGEGDIIEYLGKDQCWLGIEDSEKKMPYTLKTEKDYSLAYSEFGIAINAAQPHWYVGD